MRIICNNRWPQQEMQRTNRKVLYRYYDSNYFAITNAYEEIEDEAVQTALLATNPAHPGDETHNMPSLEWVAVQVSAIMNLVQGRINLDGVIYEIERKLDRVRPWRAAPQIARVFDYLRATEWPLQRPLTPDSPVDSLDESPVAPRDTAASRAGAGTSAAAGGASATPAPSTIAATTSRRGAAADVATGASGAQPPAAQGGAATTAATSGEASPSTPTDQDVRREVMIVIARNAGKMRGGVSRNTVRRVVKKKLPGANKYQLGELLSKLWADAQEAAKPPPKRPSVELAPAPGS